MHALIASASPAIARRAGSGSSSCVREPSIRTATTSASCFEGHNGHRSGTGERAWRPRLISERQRSGEGQLAFQPNLHAPLAGS